MEAAPNKRPAITSFRAAEREGDTAPLEGQRGHGSACTFSFPGRNELTPLLPPCWLVHRNICRASRPAPFLTSASRGLPWGEGRSSSLGRGEEPAPGWAWRHAAPRCVLGVGSWRGAAAGSPPSSFGFNSLPPKGGSGCPAPVGVVTSSGRAECLPGRSRAVQPALAAASFPALLLCACIIFFLLLFISLLCCVTHEEALERHAGLGKEGEFKPHWPGRLCHPPPKEHQMVPAAARRCAGPLRAVNDPARAQKTARQPSGPPRAPSPPLPLPPWGLGSGAGAAPALGELLARAGQCHPLQRGGCAWGWA